MAFLHGRGGQVWLSPGTGNSGNPLLLGGARSWEFQIDQDFIRSDGFNESWATWLPMPHTWTFTAEGNLDSSDDTAFQAMLAASPPSLTAAVSRLLVYPNSATSARYYSGYIWPRLRITGSIKEIVRYTLTGPGQGALVEV